MTQTAQPWMQLAVVHMNAMTGESFLIIGGLMKAISVISKFIHYILYLNKHLRTIQLSLLCKLAVHIYKI